MQASRSEDGCGQGGQGGKDGKGGKVEGGNVGWGENEKRIGEDWRGRERKGIVRGGKM